MSAIQEYFPLEAMAAKYIMFLLKNTSVYFLKYTTTGASPLLFMQAAALPVPLY